MIEELSLLTDGPHPRARRFDPETSLEAAQVAARSATTVRSECLAVLARHDGLTDFELAELVGRQQTSAGKRRGELVELGLVEWSGEFRPAPSGCRARVWRCTPAGFREAGA